MKVGANGAMRNATEQWVAVGKLVDLAERCVPKDSLKPVRKQVRNGARRVLVEADSRTPARAGRREQQPEEDTDTFTATDRLYNVLSIFDDLEVTETGLSPLGEEEDEDTEIVTEGQDAVKKRP